MLAEGNRRPKLREAARPVSRGHDARSDAFIEIENAQHMDIASAELLSFVAGPMWRATLAIGRCPPAIRLRVRGA